MRRRKSLIYFFILTSTLIFVPRLMAWSDDVSGVLMPEPRGGGGISADAAENAVSGSDEEESGEPQALIEWE